MEDGGEVELKVLVFEFRAGDVMKGLGAAFEEEMIEGLGLVEAQGSKWLGDGIEAKACSEMD